MPGQQDWDRHAAQRERERQDIENQYSQARAPAGCFTGACLVGLILLAASIAVIAALL